MSGTAPVGSWTRHWDPSSELFFYYDRSTGRTTWDHPDPPDQVFDSPRALQRRADDSAAIEGVVLQKTRRSNGSRPCEESGTAQQPDALVHQHAAAAGHPKHRKRIASKDSRVYTDTLLHKDSSIEDEEPRKDYIGFAKEYCMTAPFRDTGGKQSCVICQKYKASGVFFPCEHKCACRRCIEREGFGKTAAASGGGSLCPVCCEQVVFVAPNKGGKKETELYWRWVEEVKPSLPRDFRHNFHMAAILLKIKTEPDSDKTWDRPSGSACCVLS
ncbi:unnamed protein product [Pylaiella littoralis]